MNKGKIFEQQWKHSAEKQELLIIRLSDSDMSFHPNKELRSRFTVQQPCDYIMHYNGNIFFLELKSTMGKSIGFEREAGETAMIKLHQINSLTNLSQFDEAQAGFVFNFRDERENFSYSEDTYFMSIQNFNDFYSTTDKKSINKVDIVQHGGIIVEEQQKRKLYNYNVKKMLSQILQEW